MGSRLFYSSLRFAFRNCNSTELYRCKNSRKLYNHCVDRLQILNSRATGIFLYSSDSPAKCWNCEYPYKSEVFCQKCKTLQVPPENLNYFQILGIKENYDVQANEIKQKYRELQNVLHPDKFSNRSEKEKQISADVSSLINKAYDTLSHPLSRGLYMLSLKNINLPEGTTSLNSEFLMEIMERNEKVEAASKDTDKVIELVRENDEILDDLSKQVSEAFKGSNVEKAKLLLIKMKYYASLQGRLKSLKQDLGIVN